MKNNGCSFSETDPRPSWIDGSYTIHGYYTGRGQAFKNDSNTTEQEAKDQAISDLAKNIEVKIESRLVVNTEQKTSGQESGFVKTVTSNVISSVNNIFRDLEQVATWKDTKNCSVWVLVKIRRELIDGPLQIQKAEQLYENARVSTLPRLKRVENIEKAIDLITNTDFSGLPIAYGAKPTYLQKYQALKSRLTDLAKENEIIYVSHLSDDLPEALRHLLVSGFSGEEGTDACGSQTSCCSKTAECIDFAKDIQARWLVRLSANAKTVPGDFGMWAGTLHMTAELFDVNMGTLLKKETGSEKTFSFDKNGFTRDALWQKSVENHLKKGGFSSFLSQIERIKKK